MDTRLIIDEPGRGSWNMAVDESLLLSVGQGRIATLRLYRWEQPTLSLGYFQRFDARCEHPPSAKLPVVRRATGGGAIIHDHELTYSFVTPIRNRFSSEAQDFVKQFHALLIATLAAWNIEATLCGDTAAETKSEPFLCFQRRNSLDIIVANAKVVGSAQRRHQGALLQHGSILLARSPFAEALPGLSDLSDKDICHQEIGEDWSQRLAHQFGFRYRLSTLTKIESAVAAEIEACRFAQDSWTQKR
ncbi:MAG: lipoate--protein ligase family protein [Planctomycetia bacterium]|nr:lipoate--protein ligase family protein [Planctomycetia bacterium]